MSIVHDVPVKVEFYIMNDFDLAVPAILGMEFLLKSGMIIDFQHAQYTFPAQGDAAVTVTHPFYWQDEALMRCL